MKEEGREEERKNIYTRKKKILISRCELRKNRYDNFSFLIYFFLSIFLLPIFYYKLNYEATL